MPKMNTRQDPRRFVAAVFDSNGKDVLVRATYGDYPPTDEQIDAFLRTLGYTTTEWTVIQNECPPERFNLLWLAADGVADDKDELTTAWATALEETCGDDNWGAP